MSHAPSLSNAVERAGHGAPMTARPSVQGFVLAGASVVALALAIYLGSSVGVRQAALLVIGVGLGAALYHAAFGFTAAYRRFVLSGRGAGLRAQLIMLGLASLAFAPLLAYGSHIGGALAPIGVSLLAGAFLFGIGMQLAGGCASGTLYTVGGGSTRMLIVLAAFIAGSYLGTWHFDWWEARPSIETVSLYRTLTWPGGLAAQAAFLVALYGLTLLIERRRQGSVEGIFAIGAPHRSSFFSALMRGPWPLIWGAIALALLNLATLLVAGRPWGITSAFAWWGAKLASLAGAEPTNWSYWQRPATAQALEAGLEHDITSVMNLGIVLGALMAAALAGRFAPTLRIDGRSALAALVGGLLLGYGARLAYGCNIGAFFSGVASGSVHGWVWLVAALAGTLIGVRLRPCFGLANEPPTVR